MLPTRGLNYKSRSSNSNKISVQIKGRCRRKIKMAVKDSSKKR